MPRLLPAVHPVTTDMTQCWPDRDQLSGDLPQTGHTLTTITTTNNTNNNYYNYNSNSIARHSATTTKTTSSVASLTSSISSLSSCSFTASSSSSSSSSSSIASSLGSSPSSSSSSSPIALTSHQQSPRAEGSAVASRARHRPNGFTQVRQLPGRCVVVVLPLLLALLLSSQPVMGKPWYQEQNGHVTFNTKFCEPLSTEELQRRWESAPLDEKRTAPERWISDDFMNSGYQGDDPHVTHESDLIEEEQEWDSDEEEWIGEREEDIITEDGMMEEDEEVVERRSWRKSWPSRVSSKSDSAGSESGEYASYTPKSRLDPEMSRNRQTFDSDSYPYMRRRRRRRASERTGSGLPSKYHKRAAADEDEEEEEKEEDVEDDDDEEVVKRDSIESKRKKSKKGQLHLRLAVDGRNKSLRKQLKKKFRQRARNSRKPPPWECKMIHKNMIMKEGIYPRTLASGECATDKCFYRLYTCTPQMYQVKILRRDLDRCNPRPSLTNMTEYEEHWRAEQFKVVVGCNCDTISRKRGRAKSRRRN